MRSVLLIFIDGLGLGENDPDRNPLARFDPPVFRRFFAGPLVATGKPVVSEAACLVPTDAGLGVAGLPQSATGQTALFTGLNAPRILGRHIAGFPGPALAKLIATAGIMGDLAAAGYGVTSANMYTPDYFELVARRKRRHSASTLTILGAGIQLRTTADLLAGEAVYQDITNEMLPALGVSAVPAVTPAEAGRRLVALARRQHFTMFEYFQTDRAGHKRDWPAAARILATLDGFLAAVFAAALPAGLLTIVTSDHGNFEDFSQKTHTRNMVPTIVAGPECRETAARIRDLTDFKPAITDYLKKGGQYD